jgi:hypothetical protein
MPAYRLDLGVTAEKLNKVTGDFGVEAEGGGSRQIPIDQLVMAVRHQQIERGHPRKARQSWCHPRSSRVLAHRFRQREKSCRRSGFPGTH